KSNTGAPQAAAIALVRSVEPVSTTITSWNRPAAEARQAGRVASSFLTIRHSGTPPPDKCCCASNSSRRGRGGASRGARPSWARGRAGQGEGRIGRDVPRGGGRGVVTGAVLRPPLGAEALEVVGQLLAAIDAQGSEGAAAEVMHEHVLRHQQAEARAPRPHRQV